MIEQFRIERGKEKKYIRAVRSTSYFESRISFIELPKTERQISNFLLIIRRFVNE